jgi:predicted tellurium resistance membrane protein TerC
MAQIVMLDLVFSIDSIITAVGMTPTSADHGDRGGGRGAGMLLAATPLPTSSTQSHVVMLALGFLLMIGMVLIADGFGAHVPRGYIYAAMAFSVLVELLNIFARRARKKRGQAATGAKS